MNETTGIIMKRRSCRAFKDEQVSDGDLKTIIDCGLWAPSAMNRQDWHFSVVRERALIDELSGEIKKLIPQPARDRYKERHNGREDYSMFYGARTLVFVAGDEASGSGETDAAFAAGNMCIAAESLGLATCIVGLAAALFASDKAVEYRKRLRIPEGYKPYYALAIGYRGADPFVPERAPGKVDYIG